MKLQKKTLLIRERDAQRGNNRTRRRAGPAISWPASGPPGPLAAPSRYPLANLLPVWPGPVLLVSLVRAVLRVLRQLAFLVLPAPAAPLLSLVPADLLVPRPLAFLVLSGPEAASLVVRVTFTAAPGPTHMALRDLGVRQHRQLWVWPLRVCLQLWVVATPLLGAPWRLCLRQFQL